ncbi:MAG: glycoside hydrolase family 15 protein [Candidatus Woesebacteria bacterium]|jgi:GH15 family glucan-1,4-alpha-glucosidase
MTRPLILSNGSLNVGINLYGEIHDFYYPYVGLENHAAAGHMRWKIGVWTANGFSWLDDGNWSFKIKYERDALIGEVTARNDRLGVLVQLQNCVDADFNAFIQNIHVVNEWDTPREIRIFLHQVMRISNSLNGDTAQYLPLDNAILHYKGSRAFVFGAQTSEGEPFDQYSVGVYAIEGKEGTYKDAEDGVLSGNPVEHGSVDSVMGFNLFIEAHESKRLTYWVSAGLEHREALHIFRRIRIEGIHKRMLKTATYWHDWLKPAKNYLYHVDKEFANPLIDSLLIIKAHIDKRGAVIAAVDTTMLNYSRDAYAYCWPRDAAFVLWPLLRMGYYEEVKNFLYFCRHALQPEGYLMHKYMSDGTLGSSWHPYCAAGRVIPPIQEDETAIVLFLLGQYYEATKDDQMLQEFYDSLVRPAANFLASYIDDITKLPRASYDLWEEKLLTTTYTTAVVHAALLASARLAEVMGRQQEFLRWQVVADDIQHSARNMLFNRDKQFFYKGFLRTKDKEGHANIKYDETVDVSSFYGAFMFGLFDVGSDEVEQSYLTLERTFGFNDKTAFSIPRYEYDSYNRTDPSSLGNPWFVTTLWMAQYYIETGRAPQARRIINWVKDNMLESGVLSEQINSQTQAFSSVAPLAWSQAEFVNSVIDLASDPFESIEQAEPHEHTKK